jgi:hypothetical protein
VGRSQGEITALFLQTAATPMMEERLHGAGRWKRAADQRKDAKMAATKSLNDLLYSTMQDIYYAERQILRALPKLAKASENEQLKQALTHHREETPGSDRTDSKGVRSPWEAREGADVRGHQRARRRG